MAFFTIFGKSSNNFEGIGMLASIREILWGVGFCIPPPLVISPLPLPIPPPSDFFKLVWLIKSFSKFFTIFKINSELMEVVGKLPVFLDIIGEVVEISLSKEV